MTEQMTYRDGVLSVRLDYLLDAMSNEEKLELVERLSCEEAVIKHVADQIVHGCTEDGSHGNRGCTASLRPHTALDDAEREIARASSEIARKEIERLEAALASSEKRFYELANEIREAKTRCY